MTGLPPLIDAKDTMDTRERNSTAFGCMTSVLDRFLKYVQYDTRSDETSKTYPSTQTQLILLRDLAGELREIGLADAAMDEHGYVMATIPATTTKQGVPTIGFI